MTKKILVLEDEDNIRSFIVINLKRGGYDTVEFSSGEKAVEYMHTHDDVAVAILDVMLPGLNGFEIARRARSKGIKTPILMLTAKAEEFALQIVIGFKAVVTAGGIQNPVSDVYQIQKMAELFGCQFNLHGSVSLR